MDLQYCFQVEEERKLIIYNPYSIFMAHCLSVCPKRKMKMLRSEQLRNRS